MQKWNGVGDHVWQYNKNSAAKKNVNVTWWDKETFTINLSTSPIHPFNSKAQQMEGPATRPVTWRCKSCHDDKLGRKLSAKSWSSAEKNVQDWHKRRARERWNCFVVVKCSMISRRYKTIRERSWGSQLNEITILFCLKDSNSMILWIPWPNQQK